MNYWRPKPHFKGNPMWTRHKPEDHDHGTFPAQTPKTEKTDDLQLQDKLSSLIVVVKKDFS